MVEQPFRRGIGTCMKTAFTLMYSPLLPIRYGGTGAGIGAYPVRVGDSAGAGVPHGTIAAGILLIIMEAIGADGTATTGVATGADGMVDIRIIRDITTWDIMRHTTLTTAEKQKWEGRTATKGVSTQPARCGLTPQVPRELSTAGMTITDVPVDVWCLPARTIPIPYGGLLRQPVAITVLTPVLRKWAQVVLPTIARAVHAPILIETRMLTSACRTEILATTAIPATISTVATLLPGAVAVWAASVRQAVARVPLPVAWVPVAAEVAEHAEDSHERVIMI